MITSLICNLLTIYMVILAARAVLSWFPMSPGSALAPIARILVDVTEPVLAPLRRLIPQAGVIDLSFLVAFFGLSIIRNIICG
ncbi:MAG: YggT family protein [Acidimicrobiia bacterium]|nr:YggT family protein [Acidimicrobiia bacterium]